MPTSKSRINISVSDNLKSALTKLARRDRVPTATKAAHMLEIALEIEEDGIWQELAQSRDIKGARYLSHIKAWK